MAHSLATGLAFPQLDALATSIACTSGRSARGASSTRRWTTWTLRHAGAPTALRAVPPGDASEPLGDSGPTDEDARSRLSRMMQTSEISGRELRELVVGKWGRSFDVRIQRRGSRVYLHVMWRFLEQKSFPLTDAEYQEQLDAVAQYLTDWGAASTVRAGIAAARRAPGFTTGGAARAVSIPLNVDVGAGSRSDEWE